MSTNNQPPVNTELYLPFPASDGSITGVELRPVRFAGDGDVEECEEADAQWWALYLRNTDGSALCCADCETKNEAQTLRDVLKLAFPTPTEGKPGTLTITLPTIDQCEFELQAIPEDTAPTTERNNPEFVADVRKRIESAGPWGWCIAQVKCRWKWADGSDSLGECSYDDADDFREHSGYYEDMKKAAYDDMIASLQQLAERE